MGGVGVAAAGVGVLMWASRTEGVRVGVTGVGLASSVPGITGVAISIPPGGRVTPLPEGDRYLGFVFACGNSPDEVEAALRDGGQQIRPDIA